MLGQSKVAALSALFLLLPAAVGAQELCYRDGATIVGDPVEISIIWPIDPKTPPHLLARPEKDVTDLFSDLSSNSERSDCLGGSITGAIECEVTTPMRELPQPASDSTEDLPVDALNGADQEDQPVASRTADYSREISGRLTVRPVYQMSDPPQVRLVPVGGDFQADRTRLTKEAAERANRDWKALIDKLKGARLSLGAEQAEKLAGGETISPGALFAYEGSQASELTAPATLSLPTGCQTLFSLRLQQAGEARELQTAADRVKRLQQQKKEFEDLPLLDRLADDRSVDKFDTQIKIAQNRLRNAAQAYDTTRQRIVGLNNRLNDAEHHAELDAIGFDPDLIKAADLQRTQKAVEAYRDYRLHEKQRAKAIAEYQHKLNEFDDRIASAPDESTRLGIEEQRDRFQRAYDSWTDHSNGVTASRFRELARQFEQNDADGLGPKSFQELTDRVESTGSRPEDVLENYLDEEINRARRIAQSDAVTLGGSSTRDTSALRFAEDTAQAYAEEFEKAELSVPELIEGMEKLATGDESAFEDQARFWSRFGRYSKGAAKGAAKGVVEGAGLLHDAATLGLEAEEARLERVLTDLNGGEEVVIDYFGDRKTRAFNKAVQGAGDALHGTFRDKGYTPGAGRLLEAGDVWDEPSQLGNYLVERSLALNDSVAAGTDAVLNSADRGLARMTRGGETALRDNLEKGGELVGEFSDIGFLAFGDAARLARYAGEVLDKADDAVDASRAVNRLGFEATGDAARTARLEALDLPGARETGVSAPVGGETSRLPDLEVPGGLDTSVPRSAVTDISTPDFLLRNRDLPGTKFDPTNRSALEASNLPDGDFAAPVKSSPAVDPRDAKTYLRPDEVWDLGPDQRFQHQLLPEFSSADQATSGTIFGADLERGTFALAPNSEIILNDGQRMVLGDRLGQGGFKSVHEVPGRQDVVDKVVSYPAAEFDPVPGRRLDAGELDNVVYDNEVGRTLLQQAQREAGEGVFSVTSRHGEPILLDDPFNPNSKVLITREDNIASDVAVLRADGTSETYRVSNAMERLSLRSNPVLTEAEQMTVQLAMRKLNDQGLVWTDHKLSNFDIVPDDTALTGHRMVFFDHDGVRVASGASPAEKAVNAREMQKIFDSLDGRSEGELFDKLREAQLPGFDYRVLGKRMHTPTTPGVNVARTEFQRLNQLTSQEFSAALREFGQRAGKDPSYAPGSIP